MRQHPIQLLALVERAAHRDTDRPVISAGRPRWRSGDVAKLFSGVEDNRDRIGGVGAERLPDAEIGAIEDLQRFGRNRRFSRAFERYGEMRPDGVLHAIVQLEFAAPAIERRLCVQYKSKTT